MEEQQLFQQRTDLSGLRTAVDNLKNEIGKVIVGQDIMIELLLAGLLADGHVLIEGVPGVAKTLTAKLLARAVSTGFSRIQFTPDLMPSDVTGTAVFNPKETVFQFKPGPIFSNIILIDEINRAPAKTQAALFEVMEERQVTVDGSTYPLEMPFMVVATQNPVEMEGTYPLPEAQRDRFTARVSIGYPDGAAELEMLGTHGSSSPLDDLEPVAHATDIRELISAVRAVHIAQPIKQYVISLVSATRSSPELRLGASPRASLHLLRASRAYAALDGRDFVIPDDVQALAGPVLAHRLLPTSEAMVERELPERVLSRLVERLPLPLK